ncbi:MAG: outer membrane beta-barrel protein [Bacteroidales bacterium]|nr:outer membrane beta-barrel protein [Bacteroidales bacterium]
MRTIYLLLFLLLSISIFAQHQIGANIGYGKSFYDIKAGESNQNSVIDYDAKEAFEIELVYKNRWPGLINFGASVSYQHHHLLINENWENNTSKISKSVDYKLNNIYIKAFPEFVFKDKITYYLQIGPSLSVLVNSSADGYLDISSQQPGSFSTIHNTINGTANDVFNTFSFGFFMGFGIDYPINENIILSLSSQFDYSVNSWFKSESNTYSSRAMLLKIGANYIIREVK